MIMKILLAKLMAHPPSATMELQALHFTSHCKQRLAHWTKFKKTTVFRHCTTGRAGRGLLRKGKHTKRALRSLQSSRQL